MNRTSKKQDIIAGAIRLLALGGSDALTASALAEAAGVSKANIFHHFASLDDIVLAALEAFLMEMPSMWPAPGTSLRDWLSSLGAGTAEQLDADPALSGAYFAFAARANGNAALRQRLAEIARLAQAHFESVLGQLAPDRFDPKERKAIAGLILLTGDGLALHRQLFPERAVDQAEAWRAFVDHIAPQETNS